MSFEQRNQGRPDSRGSGPKPYNKPKTMAEFQQEAKAAYFKKHYAEILNFEQTKQMDGLIEETETFIKELGQDLTTHQLRQVFSRVKAASTENALKLLRPQLAYVAARAEKDNAKKIITLLEGLIQEVDSLAKLANFKVFFEALVAYHKFYHGSKN